jgi:hypothetical protein
MDTIPPLTFWHYAVVALAGLLYFLPALAASRRRHPGALAVFFLNLFFGWTLLGWVAALIWAFAGRPAEAEAERQPCPHCAEAVLPAARVCPHCRLEIGEKAPVVALIR